MENQEEILTPSQEKNEELFTKKRVEKTPFTIIGNEKNGYRIVCGQFYLTEENFKTTKEAEKEAKKITWDKICTVIGISIEMFNKQNQNV